MGIIHHPNPKCDCLQKHGNQKLVQQLHEVRCIKQDCYYMITLQFHLQAKGVKSIENTKVQFILEDDNSIFR